MADKRSGEIWSGPVSMTSSAILTYATGQRGNIEDAQRTWLKARDTCGERVSCLKSAYDDRIRALNDVVSGVASRGPF